MTMPPTSYDQVAYPGFPYPETRPSHLAVVGSLFGLEPASPDGCRVLELGCGDGQNLIPMALKSPRSQFVGVDLADSAVAAGRRYIAELGLGNLELICQDLLSFDCDSQAFDYVIAHGIYSWVPPQVQEKILSLVRRALSPMGIAYISYNAMPGGHGRLMMREMMEFHTRSISEPKGKLESGRALMGLLATAGKRATAYHTMVAERWEEDIAQRIDEVLIHDELGPWNENLYFHEFMARATAHGLQFVAEANLLEMFPPAIDPRVAEFLERFGEDVLAREQYLDFATGRRFRRTLLCHAGLPTTRQMSLAKVPRLFVAGSTRPLGPLFEPDAASAVAFQGVNRAILTVSHPLVKGALALLHERAPEAFSPDELRLGAIERMNDAGIEIAPFDRPSDHAQLVRSLFEAFRGGLVEIDSLPRGVSSTPGERPTIAPLARLQAKTGAAHLTTLLHTWVSIDTTWEREILSLLDGTQDRSAIVDFLECALRAGRLALSDLGGLEAEAADLRPELSAKVEQFLTDCAQLGLLVADVA